MRTNNTGTGVSGTAPMPYFSIRRDSENQAADIYIFGDIAQKRGGLSGLFQSESDQSSYSLANQVAGIPEDWDITVHINSNGGQLKEGLGIYNVLKERSVTTICEGFAASAGSIVFAAGRRRIMQPASLLFIHQAFMGAEGNADDFAKISEDLRVVTDAAVAAYKESGITISDEDLYSMLRAESWITPEDAVRMGFATEVSGAEDPDGEIQNDAMRSIMAAVSRAHGPELQVGVLEEAGNEMESQIGEMYAVFKDIMSAAESRPSGFKAIVGSWLNKYAPSPAPSPAQGGNKGFFNFKAPEKGEGGEQ